MLVPALDPTAAGAVALPEPESEIARPNGRLWRRQTRRLCHDQRPRGVVQRGQARVVVVMTHDEALGLYLAQLAWPEADWSAPHFTPGWFRRSPAPPTHGAYRLQEVHGDAGGSFPGLVCRPVTISGVVPA